MDHEPGGQVIQLQQTSQTLIGRYRRNRKLQSCEPCRKSKLACDHSVPCGRCIRRRCVDKCFYHPNPLTRSRHTVSQPASAPAVSPSSPVGSSRGLVQSIEPPHNPKRGNPVRFVGREAPVVHRASSAPPLHHAHGQEVVRSEKQSFLGSTSVTSMLTEDLEKLGVPSVDLQTFSAQSVAISYDRITKGCEVLAFLKNNSMVNQFIDCFYGNWEGDVAFCVQPIMKMWLMELWRFHGGVLKSQNPDKIRQLCELIWRNTQSPLTYNGKTLPKHWILMSTGANLRWDVIGLVACYVASAVVAGDTSKKLLEEYQTTQEAVMCSMVDIAATCLTFCRECEILDDTFLWLAAEYYALIGFVKGDVSSAVYRAGAELASTFLAMGLHQDIRANTSVPPFLAQLRKQARMVTYSTEISVSAFLGRPPRLSYRYINLDTGYDFTSDEVLAEESEFAANVSKLLEGGYNSDGRIRPITFWKVWIPFAILREQILELALGDLPAHEVLTRADEIQQRTKEQWAKMPAIYARCRDEELLVGAKKTGITLHGHILRQATRANEFLLQRVLFQKAGVSVEGLIKVAQQMFKDIIRMSEDPELTKISSINTNHMVAIHGLRCAAVLAIELLRQEQLPVYPKEPLLPRSQTIQDLSVFVSRLDLILKVELLQGALPMCEQGRKVLTRILDKILSPPSAADRACQSCCHTGGHQQAHQQSELDGFQHGMVSNDGGDDLGHTSFMVMDDFNFAIDAPYLGPDHDFRQWLENMDWTQTLP
ncbi:hypothetical protein PG993_010674 [Apiospora rasikravindrae]|uniref:Zn(2)-C6 fungal-type domain-containing protein n=1 Tax=Apiospora rasikravindrae TaxID=990691 RepID=A0ABR1SMZ3_9PEZI